MSLPPSAGGKKARAGGSPSGAAGRRAVASAILVCKIVRADVQILVLRLACTFQHLRLVSRPIDRRAVSLALTPYWWAGFLFYRALNKFLLRPVCRRAVCAKYGLTSEQADRWIDWKLAVPVESEDSA